MEYLSKKTIETDFVHRLDREVQRVRDNQKWRKEYMQRQSDWIEDREEAKEEGKLELLNQYVSGMKAKNISETEIKNNLMDILHCRKRKQIIYCGVVKNSKIYIRIA